MEPRPQRPSRATGPYINTGTPSPTSGSQPGYGTGAYDASSAPPAPPPAIGYDPDYSPGQPLTPLKGPRGANIVGPLLAVAALAIIVAAVAFIVSQFRSDGGDDNNTTSAQQTVAAAVDETPNDEDAETEVAGDDEPTAESGDDGNEEPTEEVAAAQDDGDAEPSSTPRVNRATETDDLASDDGSEDAASGEEESAEKTRARQWLPTASGIGTGFEQTENGSRGAEEVVASFPLDQADAIAAALDENGWQENVFRNFTSETAGDDEVYVVSVSVHRFDSEKGAKAALELFAEGGRVGQGLTEVKADKLGEGSVVLQGQIDGGNIYVVYVRQGEFIFRIGGLSRTGDPAEFTTDITNQIIEP
jgi:hypothetical protein